MKRILRLIKENVESIFWSAFFVFSVLAILSNWFDFCHKLLFVLAYLVVWYIKIIILFDWIINPIKKYINNRHEKI